MQNNCLVILGATASGKTKLACELAHYLNGEIISADSRQVYKHLTIGTGKDLDVYTLNGKEINHHLIDIIEPNIQFYLHDFVRELKIAFDAITTSNKLPIICGGTGLYLDALRKDFSFTQIPQNEALRNALENLSKEDLLKKLNNYNFNELNKVDINSKKRLIRAIEIAEYLKATGSKLNANVLPYKPYYIGLKTGRDDRRINIDKRLILRIEAGLIEEVEALLKQDITHERLQFLGLEYKFISNYLLNKISKDELILQLSTAINQYAKRQGTWFRKMEKEGVNINWLDRDYNLNSLITELKEVFMH